MRTSIEARGSGVASALVQHILDHAKQIGLSKISLETGSANFFKPAQKLYQKFGFEVCKPFADYKEDVNSVFMSKLIK